MDLDLLQTATSVATVGVASWLTYLLTSKQTKKQEVRARRLASASDLAPPLRELRVLLRRHGRLPVEPDEVASAFRSWAEAFDRQGHRLPGRWAHASRSVRAAVGTVFGAVTFVDIRPNTASEPLAEPDAMWQDFADDYLGHVLDRVVRWGDSEPERRLELLDFDKWLVRTERRRPIGQNGLLRGSEALA